MTHAEAATLLTNERLDLERTFPNHEAAQKYARMKIYALNLAVSALEWHERIHKTLAEKAECSSTKQSVPAFLAKAASVALKA